MAEENGDKISMSRGALNVLLKEAERHGPQEVQAMADRVADYDEDDFGVHRGVVNVKIAE